MSRLRSNKVVNQAGSGAPELTYGAVIPNTGTISGAGGINVTGIVTAASFSGDGSALTGVGDPSAIKSGSDVKVQAISTGANVTGNLAATGNVTAVDGTFSGNLTVQGTTTTIDTATLSIEDKNIGIGSVTTPSNTTADGGGVTLFGGADGDKTITYNNSESRWKTNIGVGIKPSSNVPHLKLEQNNANDGWKFWADGPNGGHLYIQREVSSVDTTLFSILNSGNVGIKTATPRTSLDIKGTDAVVVPVGTTAERPTAAAGMFRYNTTEGKFEGYTTEWGEIGGGGGLTTAAHVANNAVVTLNLDSAQDHKVTATGICTITCTGGTEAISHTIRIINSGSATVGFSTYFLFPSGNAPVLPSTTGAINLVSFTVNRVGAAGTQLLTGASLNYS